MVSGRPATDRIRKFDRAADNGLEHIVAERVDNSLKNLARVQCAPVVHGGEDAVESRSPGSGGRELYRWSRSAARHRAARSTRTRAGSARRGLAVSALTVRRPSDGWQSIRMTS